MARYGISTNLEIFNVAANNLKKSVARDECILTCPSFSGPKVSRISPEGDDVYSDRGGDDGDWLGKRDGRGHWQSFYQSLHLLKRYKPLDAIRTRAATSGSVVTALTSDTDLTAARTAATGKAVALVFITVEKDTLPSRATPGTGIVWLLGIVGRDALVAAVAAVNKNTVVVVNAVGPITMESWITNSNGACFVSIGFGHGAEIFSARRSGAVFRVRDKKLATVSSTAQSGAITPIAYSEGIFIDYRHFDQAGITSRFEFGFVGWEVITGTTTISVGASSRDIRLTGTIVN
ncbi:hypothetical protein C8F01DRAFT_1248202 [Mycena amicta]|nr:hypothetical protein C8F01DRAFT_1248202 [Mycena amicta]